MFTAAGGVPVGFGGDIKGVAGDRWLASILLVKRECTEETEPRLEGLSASDIVGRTGVWDGRLCGSRDDSSVLSSSTASSSIAGTATAFESDSVKPR